MNDNNMVLARLHCRLNGRKQEEPVAQYPGVKKFKCECYYLRMLSHHVCGATSFTNLKIANGVVHPIFQNAYKALERLEDKNHWNTTIKEAAQTHIFDNNT